MTVEKTVAAAQTVDGQNGSKGAVGTLELADSLPETGKDSKVKAEKPKTAKKPKASKPKAEKKTKVSAKPKAEKKVKASKPKAEKKAKAPKAKTEKKAKKQTVKEKLLSQMNAGRALSQKNGKSGFLSLKEIYKRLHAETVGAQAAIRGILNRDCLDAKSTFERNPEDRGAYRLRGNAGKPSNIAA